VLGDDMRARVIGKGVAPDRVVVVRDGAALPAAPPEPGRAAAALNGSLAREIRGGDDFVVMHAGNIGFGGAWDALLGAAAALAGERVALVFVGDGAARATLRRQASGLAAVRWIDRRPAADVPAVLAAGDLQVVTVRRGLEGVIVPSKLYPVLAAGRPVLAVAPQTSDVVAIVREHACGWIADPDDAADVARAIREAMRDPAELAERGRRARAAAAQFDRGALLAQYVREIEAVVPRRTSRGRVA
jgi:glycosyltransferase involved in cell wall biosynthesis